MYVKITQTNKYYSQPKHSCEKKIQNIFVLSHPSSQLLATLHN